MRNVSHTTASYADATRSGRKTHRAKDVGVSRMAGQPSEAAEAYEKILTASLQRAVDFLKFAETKNAALLALSSAWVLAAINLESSGKVIPGLLAGGVVLALFLSLCAAMVAMLSFVPKLHLPGFLGGQRAGPHPHNLLYFGDISGLTIKTLEADLHERYFPKGKAPTDEYIHDLVVQIGVNSQIAKRKMRFFTVGVWFIVLAAVVLLLPVVGIVSHTIRQLW